jgi:hypothetical protein
MTTRAMSRVQNAGEKAASSTPTTKTAAVIRMVGRRPIRSATLPAPNAPIMAPINRRLVTSSCWKDDRPPNWFLRNSRAPETTPVS